MKKHLALLVFLGLTLSGCFWYGPGGHPGYGYDHGGYGGGYGGGYNRPPPGDGGGFHSGY